MLDALESILYIDDNDPVTVARLGNISVAVANGSYRKPVTVSTQQTSFLEHSIPVAVTASLPEACPPELLQATRRGQQSRASRRCGV